MKIIAPSLCGFAFLAVIAASPNVGAAEFHCDAGRFNCLYDAVAAANQTREADVIRFAEGIHYSLTSYPSRCAPPIEGKITIIGAGGNASFLNAQGSCAYFHVKPRGSLTLRDIAITSGNLDGFKPGAGVQRGAAVYNEGILRVQRSFLRNNGINDNFLYLSGGGAIYNAPGARAYIRDTEFLYNSVETETYGGAAILNEGIMRINRSHFFENNGKGGIIVNGIPGASTKAHLVLSDSIIENNYSSTGIKNGPGQHTKLLIERSTIRGGDSDKGGGIYNAGVLTVRESAIVRNKAIRGGGAYSAEDAKSTFINTTISHNHARGAAEGNGIGGGIYNYGGTVYLASSTIASNTSQGWGSAIAATSDADGAAYVYTKSSLIVGHAGMSPCYDFGPNDLPKLFLVENNLITEESNCYAPSETDIVVPEADTFTKVIGPLADYDGTTPSYALLPNSPAIDNEGKLCTDFNGVPILIDQRGNFRTGCDRGAVDSTGEVPPIELQLIYPETGILPNSGGTIVLAILSRADSTDPFDPVWEIERSSIRLGSAGAVPFRFTRKDFNLDGIADLVVRFKTSDTGIACGDTSVELRGTIINGADFVSSTAITTVGCVK